ncbi:hypothetical protein H5410_050272, partial [Solanum commersonii]
PSCAPEIVENLWLLGRNSSCSTHTEQVEAGVEQVEGYEEGELKGYAENRLGDALPYDKSKGDSKHQLIDYY